MSYFDTQAATTSSSKGKQHRKKHDDKNDKSDKLHKHDKHDKRQKVDKHVYNQAAKTDDSSPNSKSDNVDFLFVVNELSTDTKGRELVLDQWADVLPFPEASDYADEIPGLVFRYRNGEVTEAADYAWIRPHPGAEGCICRWTHGPDHGQPTVVYKTYSVFRRWRFSPVFWVGSDISVHGIDHYTADPQRMFISLRFYSPSPGVSQVDYRGERHVAGRDPSWMPSLVPHQYSNPFPNASRSQGLHGELPVILGLMALSQGPGFYPPTQWQRRHWRGDPQINQEFSPGPNELPRGVVVQVCYDPENGEGATQEDISKFEWNSIAVKG